MDFSVTMLSVLPEILSALGNSQQSTLSVVSKELKTLRILRALKMVVRFGSIKIIILTIIEALKVCHHIS